MRWLPPSPGVQGGDGTQKLAGDAQRGDADLLQALIGQVKEDREVEVVVVKAVTRSRHLMSLDDDVICWNSI
jgi:hypothetical protein